MREKRYCAFCRTPRTLNLGRHLSKLHFGGLAVFGLFLMWAIWQDFNPKVLPMIAFFWGLGEVLAQFRWRLSVVCPECGFDPVVYNRSPEKAALKVKEQLERRRADPSTILKSPLDLPKVPPPSEKPRLLSKQV